MSTSSTPRAAEGPTVPSDTDRSVPGIRIEGLEKVYVRTTGREIVRTRALTGVEFEVAQDEFVALVGPSGCGKTTVLKSVAGLLQPTSGRIEVGGTMVTQPGTDRGVVFQQAALLPWLTVRRNLMTALRFAGLPRAERIVRADAYLELVGLDGFADHYPAELSGGMQQRVGIARALALEPRVLLMDEPFGALDAITRKDMQVELLRLWEQQRKAVLFVTHSLDEALLLADRVVVMTRGRVAADLPVPLERPRDPHQIRRDPGVADLRHRLEAML